MGTGDQTSNIQAKPDASILPGTATFIVAANQRIKNMVDYRGRNPCAPIEYAKSHRLVNTVNRDTHI